MADGTHIEWTEATWNVVTGCTKVSAGCDHCYIERTPPFRMASRKFDKPGTGGTTSVQLHPERLTLPLKWRKPRRIFVNSLSDLFHDDVPDKYIAEVFACMGLAEWHVFQLLTKRHARMRSLAGSPVFRIAVLDAAYRMVLDSLDVPARAKGPYWARYSAALNGHGAAIAWPLPNVWLGVSVENQQWADIRIPALLETSAAVRWLSCEPLLSAVDLSRWIGGPDGATPVPGESSQEVPPGSSDVRTGAFPCDGAPVGVASLLRTHPGGADDQPQERHLDGQPTHQPGVGLGPSRGDPSPSSGRGVAGINRQRLPGSDAADLQDCARRPSISWLVCGGESGPGARPMDPDWARSLRDQCVTAGVPFFFKQWGEWCHTTQLPEATYVDLDAAINLAQAHPEPHRVGKKRAGRLLDERTWDEYPGVDRG